MDYSDKLKDPRWQRKRLEVMRRDDFTCVTCGDNHSELQIHHKQYWNGMQPWEYHHSDLITLCRSCHEKETFLRGKAEKSLFQTLLNRGFSYYEIVCLDSVLQKYPGAKRDIIDIISNYLND